MLSNVRDGARGLDLSETVIPPILAKREKQKFEKKKKKTNPSTLPSIGEAVLKFGCGDKNGMAMALQQNDVDRKGICDRISNRWLQGQIIELFGAGWDMYRYVRTYQIFDTQVADLSYEECHVVGDS
ncbi:hypothetical protein FRB98_001231, partial [Tulasnella sp. 332]